MCIIIAALHTVFSPSINALGIRYLMVLMKVGVENGHYFPYGQLIVGFVSLLLAASYPRAEREDVIQQH